jgi:glutaredoxin
MLKVYSTNCPKCKILEKKLNSMDKEYELINDPDAVYEASEKYDIKEAPFVVNGDHLYNFSAAIKALSSGEI